MRAFINISELADYGVQLSENQRKTIAQARQELAIFAPLCRLVEVARLCEEDGQYYIHDVAVLLEYNGHLIKAYKTQWNGNSYNFCLPDPYRHAHTHYYKNAHPMPNKVGAPTARKMDEWLDYLLTEETEKKAYAQEYIDKETAFRAELARLEQSGEQVSWYNESRGQIVKNNVVLEFSIDPCSISQKVSIRQSYDLGISGFLQMADNKYQPARV